MSNPINPFASATEMLAALRAHRVSAVELLEHHQARITRYNPVINAVVELDPEGAHAAALHADARRSRGEDGPLLGLPITLKEAINVKGMRTTAGMPQWAEYRADHDAPLTRALREAGAVIMGKTNVPQMLEQWQSNNPVYGRTNNPWDLSRSPGGSSGGSAAALAAGLTTLEFGSDLGGSIRVPAAFCGLYGHRPSETALPRAGAMPGASLPNPALVMSVQGPLARSASDLELALQVVCGPEDGEGMAWRISFPPARHDRLADFRVALLPPVPWIPTDAEVLAAQDELGNTLAQLGCRVEKAQPSLLGDLRRHYVVYLHLRAAVQSARMTEEQRSARLEVFRTRDDEWAAAQCRGLEATAAEYISWLAERERIRASWRAFFHDWDVLVAPAFLRTAFPHIERPYPHTPDSIRGTVEVNGHPTLYEHGVFYPSISTLAGQPATAFPLGRSKEGLPLGLQAIGPYLEDRTPIHFVELVARERGGFSAPPGYA